jgi:hypothetical protein
MKRAMNQMRNFAAHSVAVTLLWVGVGSLPAVTGAAVEPNASDRPAAKRAVFGKLVTAADRVISVNGHNVRSGATINSGAMLETPAEVSASLQLWPLGRLEIAPHSRLQLSFGGSQLEVNLQKGCVILTTYEGNEGTLRLPQGVVQHTGPKANDFLDVCVSEQGAAPLIGQGAALRAGAGTCWLGAASAAAQTSSGFNPLYLLAGVPLAVVGVTTIAGNSGDGRPAVASAAGL